VVDAGGIVVEVLEDGPTFTVAATRSDLDTWITYYGLTVTSLIAAPGAYGQTLAALGLREATAIVEIPSMKVVWYNDGDQSGAVTSAASMAIDETLRLLTP
jgi:hypothetical protein